MRQRFPSQPDLQLTPIEKIRLPLKSRDELPPILAGLQWVWMQPALKADIFALLESKILAGKQATGRTGMDLWQILVLGVVRLGLDADWDRMEDMANHHVLVRQMLGVPLTPWGEDAKVFGHQTLRDNVALLDDELLQQINARVAAAGREVFAKKGGAPLAALALKVDSYVLESDVHFPTDLNLLWDAGRKCVDLIEKYRDQFGYALPGWRKAKDWRRQLKACERTASHTVYRGGPNKEARVKGAVREYLAVGRDLCAKVQQSLLGLCDQPVAAAHWEALAYFHRMLAKHLDLVARRLLNEEVIPAHEKVYRAIYIVPPTTTGSVLAWPTILRQSVSSALGSRMKLPAGPIWRRCVGRPGRAALVARTLRFGRCSRPSTAAPSVGMTSQSRPERSSLIRGCP